MRALLQCALTGLATSTLTFISCAIVFGAANKVQEDKRDKEIEASRDSTRMFVEAYIECNTETKDFNKYLNEPIK